MTVAMSRDGGGRRRPLLLLLVFPLLVGMVACAGRSEAGDFGQDYAKIELRVVPSPTGVGPVQLALTLADASGKPIDGATVAVEGAMTHAGMESVVAQASGQGNGRYLVESFSFTMGGDWLLIVRATLSDGRRVQQTFPVKGVGAGALTPRLGGW